VHAISCVCVAIVKKGNQTQPQQVRSKFLDILSAVEYIVKIYNASRRGFKVIFVVVIVVLVVSAGIGSLVVS
jgi:hypothetical protein